MVSAASVVKKSRRPRALRGSPPTNVLLSILVIYVNKYKVYLNRTTTPHAIPRNNYLRDVEIYQDHTAAVHLLSWIFHPLLPHHTHLCDPFPGIWPEYLLYFALAKARFDGPCIFLHPIL
jgi:hypothetical protein